MPPLQPPPFFGGHVHEDNSASVHHNNIHPLAIEIYKVVNDMPPEMNFSNKETMPIIL